MAEKPLREMMPTTAAFIDAMRQAFGKADVDQVVRRGMNGEPVFWAKENGVEIGTHSPEASPPDNDHRLTQ